MKFNTNDISKVLGQKVASPTTYSPDILVREERQTNRSTVGLEDDDLPFVGYDIWNGYECSTLTDDMLPVTCIAKVVYPCTNKYIVESKSMKLYWNSFNMEPMGKDVKEVLKNLRARAAADLSALLECNVQVELFSQLLPPGGYCTNRWLETYTPFDDHGNVFWDVLENTSTAKGHKFTKFTESPELLNGFWTKKDNYSFMSTLLRSNCKITKQPDSGDIYIAYESALKIEPLNLLEYVVSFRNECHFHEEICETVFKRLYDVLKPSQLTVTCFYARRGGWDIVPTRSMRKSHLDKDLINPRVYYNKFPKQ